MNLKQSLRQRQHGGADADLDLTAVMNIFLILIPFLLLTAVFVRIAILELTLPSLDCSAAAVQSEQRKSVILNFLVIKQEGLEFKSPELKFTPIPRTNGSFNWAELQNQLKRAKNQHPESQDIIISPANSIKYETIITVMDHCRDAGFPNISISG